MNEKELTIQFDLQSDSLENLEKVFHLIQNHSQNKVSILNECSSKKYHNMLNLLLTKLILSDIEREIVVKYSMEHWKSLDLVKIFLKLQPKSYLHFFHYSVEFNRLEVLKYLVENKWVDIGEVNSSYPVYLNPENKKPQYSIIKATENFEILEYLIENTQIDVNTRNWNTKNTALHVACSKGKFDIVKLLIEKGKANANIQNVHFETPIWEAIRRRDLKIVQFLVEKGMADICSTTNALGEMVIFECAKVGDIDILKFLIEKGGLNLDAISSTGESIFHVICMYGQFEVLQFFVEYLGLEKIVIELNKEDESQCKPQANAELIERTDIVDYINELKSKH